MPNKSRLMVGMTLTLTGAVAALASVVLVIMGWRETGTIATSVIAFMAPITVLLLAIGVVIVFFARRSILSDPALEPEPEPLDSPSLLASTPVPQEPAEIKVDQDVDHLPVMPADQAQGFGWMKASDLANRSDQT